LLCHSQDITKATLYNVQAEQALIRFQDANEVIELIQSFSGVGMGSTMAPRATKKETRVRCIVLEATPHNLQSVG
jgi:hypothetical protein